MNRGQLVLELVDVATEAHNSRSSFVQHASNYLADAADYIAERQDSHARIALRVAERVLGESPLAIEVSALHDALVDVLCDERQHAPLPASLFESRRRAPNGYDPTENSTERKAGEYASRAMHRIAREFGYRDATDVIEAWS